MSHFSGKNATFLLVLLFSTAAIPFGQDTSQTAVFGGGGGSVFSDSDIPSGGRILRIHIFSANYVDAVQLEYELPDGRTVLGPRHGGSGGRENRFQLDRDEYILGISGRYGNYVDSISVRTNKRTSPLFGGSGGTRDYRIDVPSGFQAVGFVGRSAKYLDAVGLITAPLRLRQISDTPIFGGGGGSAFSDREVPAGARISEIRLRYSDWIDGIQAVYTLRDGRLVEGPFHGGSGGRADVFRLDSDEYITGVSGRYGDYVDSIVIRTNKRTSQPFGGRGGRADYRIDIPQGSTAVGFAGRSARYLDAIGLTYEAGEGNWRNLLRRLPGRP